MAQRLQNILPVGSVYSGSGEFNQSVVVGKRYLYQDSNYDGVAFYLSMDGNDFAPGFFTATVGIVTLNGNPSEPVSATLSTR